MQHKYPSKKSTLTLCIALGAASLAGCGAAEGEYAVADDHEPYNVSEEEQIELDRNELPVYEGPIKTAYLPDSTGEIRVYHYQEVDGMAVSGDMILGSIEQVADTEKGVVILNKLWPRRTLVYEIHSSLLDNKTNNAGGTTQDDKDTLAEVAQAMADWTSSTGLRFKERTNETDYVSIQESSSVCRAGVGRQGNAQKLELEPSCNVGNIRHELGHAFGLEHEHMRCGRDADITILWDNIKDSAESANFTERCGSSYSTTGAIDYDSIMMYGSKVSGDIAVDSSKNIMTKKDGSTWTSKRARLSASDVRTIRTLYSKFESPRPVTTIPARWFANSTNPKVQFCKDNGYNGAQAAEETETLAAGKRFAEYNSATRRWEAKTLSSAVRVYSEINCKF